MIITATGQTAYIQLSAGWNKITVDVLSGTCTLNPQFSPGQIRPLPLVLPDDTEVITGSKFWDMTGPGYLSFDVDAITGSVEVKVEPINGD